MEPGLYLLLQCQLEPNLTAHWPDGGQQGSNTDFDLSYTPSLLSCPCPCCHVICSYHAFQRQTWARSTSHESEWWEVWKKILFVLFCVVALKMIFHSHLSYGLFWSDESPAEIKSLTKDLQLELIFMLWYHLYSGTHTAFVFYGIFCLYYCRLSVQFNWGCKMAAVGTVHWRAEEPYAYFFLLSSGH